MQEQFEKLCRVPMVEQRTPEWYDMRNNKITASSCADVLGLNKYNRQSRVDYLVNKCVPPQTMETNHHMHHGVKYEPVANMLYETLFNTSVREFGLIPHPEHRFLAASPDGIVSKGDRVGTMVEIKSPVTREICRKPGDVCPIHYWIQIQVQLECCDLEVCDFWQCRFSESPIQYLNQPVSPAMGPIADPALLRGQIAEFFPLGFKDSTLSVPYEVRKYAYPPSLRGDMGVWKETLVPPEGYFLHGFLDWYLEDCYNFTYQRDRGWFAKNLPLMKAFWDEVEAYRKDPEALLRLQRKRMGFVDGEF